MKKVLNKKREAKLDSKLKKKGLDLADLLKENEEEVVLPDRSRKRQRLDNSEMIVPKCNHREELKVVGGGQ